LDQFMHTGDVQELERAITLLKDVLTSMAPDSASRPRCLHSLGISYQSWFEQFGEVKDINLAIRYLQEAVDSTPLDSAQASWLSNLGISYQTRFECSGDLKDIDS